MLNIEGKPLKICKFIGFSPLLGTKIFFLIFLLLFDGCRCRKNKLDNGVQYNERLCSVQNVNKNGGRLFAALFLVLLSRNLNYSFGCCYDAFFTSFVCFDRTVHKKAKRCLPFIVQLKPPRLEPVMLRPFRHLM